MPTRFSLPSSGAAAVTVPPDASWGALNSFDRVRLPPTVQSTPLTSKTVSTLGIKDKNVLVRQYISDPLAAQTIGAGTVKGIIKALESSSSDDFRAQLVIRVVSNDGQTVRGTILPADDGALASEFPTVITSRKFPLAWAGAGAATTSVVAQLGDRLVVEVGFRAHAFAFRSIFSFLGLTFSWSVGTLRFGDPAAVADAAEDETATTDLRPWVEFSQTITFDAGTAPPPPAVPPELGAFVGIARPLVRWQFFLTDKLGTKLSDVTYAMRGRRLSFLLGQPAEMAGVALANHEMIGGVAPDGLPLLAGGGTRWLKGYREEATGYVLRYCGLVELLQDHGAAEGDPLTRFSAYSPLQNLGFRWARNGEGKPDFVQFDGTPGAHIVRAVLDAANLKAKTGATTAGGTFANSEPRSVKWEFKMLRPAIAELGGTANGFDFVEEPIDTEVGDFVRVSCLTAAGKDNADLLFAWKLGPHNVSGADRIEDPSTMANAIIGIGGEGMGGSKIVTAEQEEASSLALRIRREATVTYSDVTEPAFLDALVLEHRRVRAHGGRSQYTLVPAAGIAPEPWTHFWLGDTVSNYAHDSLRGGWTGVQRIYGVELDIDDDAGEVLAGVVVSRTTGS